jgi:hypothetical protein
MVHGEQPELPRIHGVQIQPDGPVQVLHLARHALSQHHLRDKVTMSTGGPVQVQQLLEGKDGEGGKRWTRSPVPRTIYLDMREENICEGPGLAGWHGQQLLEGKDGAGGTGGHGAQCGGQNSAAGQAAPQRGAATHST